MFGLHDQRLFLDEGDIQTQGGLMYYEDDGLGNVMDLTDRSGAQVMGYEYDAFGHLFTQMAANLVWKRTRNMYLAAAFQIVAGGRIIEIKDQKYVYPSNQFKNHLNTGKPVDVIVAPSSRVSIPL